MKKKSAKEVKQELLQVLPVDKQHLAEEFARHRWYAWSQYFRVVEELEAEKQKNLLAGLPG